MNKGDRVKGIILAAGLGTRLRPLSLSRPKALLPIANKHIVYYIIEDMAKAGIKDIALVISHQKDVMVDELNHEEHDVKLTFITQENLNGIGGAVKLTQDFIGNEPFMVYLGDNLAQEGVQEFVKKFNETNPDALLLLTEVANPSAFGVAELNPDNTIKSLEEKPENPKSNLAVTGIYMFNNRIFEAINNIAPSARGELEIPDAVQWLINNNGRVISEKIKGRWKDTGKPEDLLEANQLILDRLNFEIKGEVKGEIEGNVGIGEGTVVEEGAKIVGPVIIGKNCVIGKGTYVGPYSSIGDNVTLRNADVEFVIILNNTFINTNKRIVNSIIGEKCKITPVTDDLPKGSKLVIGDYSQIEL
ncbi:glucose-1-phosphate thymidylyltransferase [Candidatus Woesearchaeota archaeon]|nr:glucose-1-phosphate thymidylyltransferase [Candidatus Woesearchaeota archaeon]